jgi:hypothetical protein
MIFDSQIAGIPCQINVTYMTEYIPKTWYDPECGGDFEFEVLDRKGYKAPWLEKKLTPADEARIYEEATT